jgi:hypothetical protein
MTLIASRKKLVTFRVTMEEYEALRGLCISRRARSISELTRGAVLQQLSTQPARRSGAGNEPDALPRSAAPDDLVTLISVLEQIDDELRHIRGRISKIVGPGAALAAGDPAAENDEPLVTKLAVRK